MYIGEKDRNELNTFLIKLSKILDNLIHFHSSRLTFTTFVACTIVRGYLSKPKVPDKK